MEGRARRTLIRKKVVNSARRVMLCGERGVILGICWGMLGRFWGEAGTFTGWGAAALAGKTSPQLKRHGFLRWALLDYC